MYYVSSYSLIASLLRPKIRYLLMFLFFFFLLHILFFLHTGLLIVFIIFGSGYCFIMSSYYQAPYLSFYSRISKPSVLLLHLHLLPPCIFFLVLIVLCFLTGPLSHSLCSGSSTVFLFFLFFFQLNPSPFALSYARASFRSSATFVLRYSSNRTLVIL